MDDEVLTALIEAARQQALLEAITVLGRLPADATVKEGVAALQAEAGEDRVFARTTLARFTPRRGSSPEAVRGAETLRRIHAAIDAAAHS